MYVQYETRQKPRLFFLSSRCSSSSSLGVKDEANEHFYTKSFLLLFFSGCWFFRGCKIVGENSSKKVQETFYNICTCNGFANTHTLPIHIGLANINFAICKHEFFARTKEETCISHVKYWWWHFRVGILMAGHDSNCHWTSRFLNDMSQNYLAKQQCREHIRCRLKMKLRSMSLERKVLIGPLRSNLDFKFEPPQNFVKLEIGSFFSSLQWVIDCFSSPRNFASSFYFLTLPWRTFGTPIKKMPHTWRRRRQLKFAFFILKHESLHRGNI